MALHVCTHVLAVLLLLFVVVVRYWINHTDPEYVALMVGVADFVSAPGSRDVPVGEIFTPKCSPGCRRTWPAWAGAA